MAGKSWGEYAYLLSLVIAVLAGIAVAAGYTGSPWVSLLLVILGVVVGFLNVTDKETNVFLLATIALVVAGTAGFGVLDTAIRPLGTLIDAIVKNIAIFAAPAAIIIAVKAIHAVAKSK